MSRSEQADITNSLRKIAKSLARMEQALSALSEQTISIQDVLAEKEIEFDVN